MTDLFTATREHDLPPRWDGYPVTWDGWKLDHIWICPPPKPEPCPYCGSLAERVTNAGTVTITGIPRIGKIIGRPIRHRIYAMRCPACGHDQVYDFAELWDLDLTDYQDEGSWSV